MIRRRWYACPVTAPASIEITTRVWVKNSDYFELQFRMYEDVKKTFDANGISIPFNQLDVHITQN
ncbi:MAG: hypothetical protein V8Q30_06235 [Acutalibacteraceae bacterium]